MGNTPNAIQEQHGVPAMVSPVLLHLLREVSTSYLGVKQGFIRRKREIKREVEREGQAGGKEGEGSEPAAFGSDKTRAVLSPPWALGTFDFLGPFLQKMILKILFYSCIGIKTNLI